MNLCQLLRIEASTELAKRSSALDFVLRLGMPLGQALNTLQSPALLAARDDGA